MTAPHILNPAAVLDYALSGASPDLMRTLLRTVIKALTCLGSKWQQIVGNRLARMPIRTALPRLGSGTLVAFFVARLGQ